MSHHIFYPYYDVVITPTDSTRPKLHSKSDIILPLHTDTRHTPIFHVTLYTLPLHHRYTSLQLGVGEAKLSRVNITTAGHYKAAGLDPKRKLMEFRVTPDSLLPVGTKISAMHFVAGQVFTFFCNTTDTGVVAVAAGLSSIEQHQS